jgi:hypothetical protein
MRDVRFVLFEMLGAQTLSGFERFSGCDHDVIVDTLNLAEKIAREQFYPVERQSDEEGLRYDTETMTVHVPGIAREPYRAVAEAGFIALSEAPEIGGMGMPQCVSIACKEYLCAASASLTFFTLLTGSVAGLIRRFGTTEQKGLYLEKMLRGEWSGTMCLTEPGAGSDVGAVRTRALRNPDGTYRIEGQKIFISAGEQDITENIIHMVLARVEGATAGTKGLSLFIVPKHLVTPDGSLAERNGVFCRGVEKKMGFHGSPTCSLSFGDDRPCTGFLLGREGSGMKIMFQMMNEERLFCGLQGLATSSSAFLHAVDYARHRIQGSHAEKMLDPSAERVAIIAHPDVKRMLLWMKAHVEAMRMLTYYLGMCLDLSEAGTREKVQEANAMVELLVPICKAGNTDLVWLVTAEAIQVFGGYGFCRDYPVEHMARACKVLSIVEGTNGIQSMDLVMRKILMNPGQKNYTVLKKLVAETIRNARPVVDERYLVMLEQAVEEMDAIVSLLLGHMAHGRITHILALATRIQQAMFMLCLAWMHVWSLSITMPKLKELAGADGSAAYGTGTETGKGEAFYRGKMLTSRFYLGTEFPGYFGRVQGILSGEEALLLADDSTFQA